MGIFGNPNRKVERVIKQLERQGVSSNNYKTRKCCEKCTYFRLAGNHCNYHNKKTYPAEYCSNYWQK